MNNFINKCKKEICKHENVNVSMEDIFVVWSCKTIQNKKAMIASNTPELNHKYYECTEHGDRGEIYIDCYKKIDKVTIKNLV